MNTAEVIIQTPTDSADKPLKRFLKMLFPYRIGRLEHLFRALILQSMIAVSSVWIRGSDRDAHLFSVVGCVLLVLYFVGFCLMPRIRDCGLSVWTGLLILVPGIGNLFGLAVLFKASEDPIQNAFKSRSEQLSVEIPSSSIAGNRCHVCNIKLLTNADGIRTVTGQPICHDCFENQSQPA